MAVYVDATTLISLGTIGELEHLTVVDGTLVVPKVVREEVTTEPARTNLVRFLNRTPVETTTPAGSKDIEQAKTVLDETTHNGDVALIAAVLAEADSKASGVVSDNRRVRTVARGFGATVTGTIGIMIRAVEEGYSEAEAKSVIRRLDEYGLHMTAELRYRALALIEEAAVSANS